MKFKTRFSSHDRFYTNAGDTYHIEYALQIDDRGVEDLVPVGKTYIPDEINSHAESVDINVILARFNNGDDSALNKRAAQYFDASDMPTNLAEMYRTVSNGEYLFNSLPLETRAKFDHSFSKFVSSIGSPEFSAAFAAPVSADTSDSLVSPDVKEIVDES